MANSKSSRPADELTARLKPVFERLLQQAGAPARIFVAFSGGLDSTALLLLTDRLLDSFELSAIHVNHGINPRSDLWRQHCEVVCRGLAIKICCQSVSVDLSTSHSLEQACRIARYGVFEQLLKPGDLLLTAHHLQDQCETVLINLARGCGPSGLAGIPPLRPLGRAWVARPLLAESKSALQQLVRASGLSWIEDPSNLDPKIARGFLRASVLPLLKSRWPSIEQTLGRSALLCLETRDLLSEYAQIDLQAAATSAPNHAVLRSWSTSRQRLIIRHWLDALGLNPPDRSQLHQLIQQIKRTRAGAQALVAWPGTEVRLYRHQLYAGTPIEFPASHLRLRWCGRALPLPTHCGKLVWHDSSDRDEAVPFPALEVRFQVLGERLKPAGKPHHRRLKNLFQEAAIPPWVRRQAPYIYSGDQLLGIGDLFCTDHFKQLQRQCGLSLQWQRPPRHTVDQAAPLR